MLSVGHVVADVSLGEEGLEEGVLAWEEGIVCLQGSTRDTHTGTVHIHLMDMCIIHVTLLKVSRGYDSHFLLCHYVTYRHTVYMYILAKYELFLFSMLKYHFLKKHQAYTCTCSSRFGQKMEFRGTVHVGNGIKPFNVRIYMYMYIVYMS